MANPEHVERLKQGVAGWNAWRQDNPEIQPDLNYANLNGVDLNQADLRYARLGQANLSKANLSYARLVFANLSGANLNGANLQAAELSSVDLSKASLDNSHLDDASLVFANLSEARLLNASLSYAHMTRVILRGANLSRANLANARLDKANLSYANLSGASLIEAALVDTDLTGAILTGCAIYGISVWDVQLEGARQDNLIITPVGEPAITVDDLEVAQFLYLLLNHKKLRNVLNAVTERGVLLLGRFGGGGLEVLQAVAAKLREAQYLPIIFDFERPRDRNYTETVKTLAGLSRFIIADLSGPSVPQELYATVPHFKIPFVPILEAGRKQFAMATDLLEYPWVVRPPVIFASTDELVSFVPSRIIAPAEEKHQARQLLLDELFHDA